MIFRRKQKGGCCGGRARRFAGFGTASYATQGKDCPPSADWGAWCDCMYPAGAERTACKKLFCANPTDSRCSPDPRLAAAPWTEVGSGARGIRTPKATFVQSVSNVTRAPSLSEFEPDVLYKTALTDPARFAFLIGLIGSIPGVLPALIIMAPQLALFGPAALQALVPLAAAYAYQRGGNTRLSTNVLGPTADLAGDVGVTLIGSISGDYKVALFQFYCRRAAKGMEQYRDETTQTARIIVQILGDKADQIIADAKGLPANASQDWFWSKYGGMLRAAGASAPGDTGKVVRLLGETLDTFSLSLADTFAGKLDAALDDSTMKLLKMPLSVAVKSNPSVVLAQLQSAEQKGRIDALSGGADVLDHALTEIDKAANGVPIVPAQIKSTIHTGVVQATAVLNKVRGFLSQWQQSGTPPPVPRSPAARPPSGARPPAGKPASASSGAVAPLVGAAVGYKVGGIPGALVAAGAALIFGKRR